MAQIIHNISFPNDGNGDELRTAFDNQNQNNTDLYTNKVDKELGKGLSTNDYTNLEKTKLAGIEDGAQVNVPVQWEDIIGTPEQFSSSVGHFYIANSLAGQSITSGVQTKLLNNNLGVLSNDSFRPFGISTVYDPINSQFDFNELDLGDQVNIRVDLLIDTTIVEQDLRVYLVLGVGTPSEKKLIISQNTYKNIVSNFPLGEDVEFSIDNEDWRTAPAEIMVLTDDAATVLVDGWHVPILRKSVNILEPQDISGKLDKNIALYPTATLPLADTDKLLISQSGVFKEVAKSELGGGGTSQTFAQSRWMFNDFYSANNPLNREPFMGLAYNGGMSSSLNKYATIASGTSANGGFRYITNNNTTAIAQGLTFFGIISLRADSIARDRVIRIGFHSATNQTAPTNGVYVEIIGSNLTFKATNASVTSSSASIALTNGVNDLYEVMIHATTAADVRCIIKDLNGITVLDTNLTTNIPTNFINNAGVLGHIVTAGANNTIIQIDYMGLGEQCPTFLLDRL